MEKIKESKLARVEVGSNDLKKAKEKLSKIKIDEHFITERTKQLASEGYGEGDAKSVASKEAMIKTDNDRIALYKENPDLKDSEEMIQKILIKRDTNQREINEILNTGVERKDIKSNRQILREAEEKLRNLTIDLGLIKNEKERLLQEGYPFDFSNKLSELNGEIRLLQNKIQILIENPKIENGLKTKNNLEDKLRKLEDERNILLISKPEIFKDDTKDINTKNNNLNKIKEEPVLDEYDEAGIEEQVKNSIGEKVVKIKEEKVSKKINWSRLNPASWFKKNKNELIDDKNREKENWIEEELLGDNKNIKKEIILSHTGAAPAFYEDELKDDDIEEIIDKKLEKEKRKIFLSHTGAAPAFFEEKVGAQENKGAETEAEKKDREEKEKAYWESRKKMFEGKTPEEIRDMLIREVELRKEIEIKNGKFGARIKSGISKGIETWDNLDNIKGVKGYAIRFTKMAASLALIGVAASFSVEKLASLGIGTAGALSGGMTSVVGKKIAFGLGFGALMETFSKMSPKKRKAMQIIMMTASAGLAIGTGGIFAGIAVGGAAATGYGLSKLVQGRFSEEKIKERFEKIKKENVIDLNKLEETSEKFQRDYDFALRKAESTRIYRKIAGGVAALVGGVAVLEASGYVHDLNDVKVEVENIDQEIDNTLQEDLSKIEKEGEEAINKEIEDILKKEDDELAKEINPISKEQLEINKDIDKTLQEDLARMEKEGEEAINKDIENRTELDKAISETKNPEIKIVSAEANGGQGAISTLRELQDKLGEEYKNVVNPPASVAHIINTDAHELAKEYGLYRPGEDAESAKVFVGDKMSFNKETGEVVFTHVRGGEDVLQQGAEYKGDMFDAGNRGAEVTSGDGKEGMSDFEKNNPQVPPTDNPFADSAPIPNGEDTFLDRYPQVPPETNGVDRVEDGATEELKNANDFNNEGAQGGSEQAVTKEPEPESDARELSPREMRQVDRVFDRNIDELFPKKQDMVLWNEFKGSNAADFYYRDSSFIEPEYESLHSYLHKINEVTGLEPKEGLFFTEQESNAEYIQRGLEKAVLMGKLDEVKL